MDIIYLSTHYLLIQDVAVTVAWLFGLGGSSDIFESLTSKCVRV